MVRFSAKIEIEPNSLAIRRIRKVPTIASPPIISGSKAATPLRKNQKVSRKSSGKTRISAVRRSCSTCVFTCCGREGVAADRDAGLPRKLVLDLFPGVLQLLVAGGLQGDPEIGRAAVLRDEVATLGLGVADHALHVPIALHLLLDRRDPLPAGGLGGGGVLDQHDHADVAEARGLEPVGRRSRSAWTGRPPRRGRDAWRRSRRAAPAMTKKIAARITVRLPCRCASDASELNITYLLSAPTRAPAVCFSRSSAARSNHSAVHSLISMP